jgi:hypothetical protein
VHHETSNSTRARLPLKMDNKSAAAMQGKLVILVDIFMNIQVHWNMSTFRLVNSDRRLEGF